MKKISLDELDILDVGNAVDLYGAIYSGKGRMFLIPLPTENPLDLEQDLEILSMSDSEMERFLGQSDVLDVRAGKAILRKSQRQIDQNISWRVFRRDGYACRYCGKTGIPLTVDHVDLWEEGGATIEQNLLTACRKCNKTRGSLAYPEWIASADYARVAERLDPEALASNVAIVSALPTLRSMRIKKRSR